MTECPVTSRLAPPNTRFTATTIPYLGADFLLSFRTRVHHETEPSVSGNIVVDTDDSFGDADVRFIDVLTGIDMLVAGGPGNQGLLAVDGTRIVYSDGIPFRIFL